MAKQATAERHEFQAEVKQVMDLMIHSLYSNKEIFLRELVSNASDALDKLRFEAIADDSLYAGDGELRVEIEIDKDAGLLTIRDNGIGMNRDEVIENIGTIARSGTRKFLEAMSGDEKADAHLIGQFGVGFYSAFIVADKVSLRSRRAGTDESAGVLWESDGNGEYTLEDVPLEHRGTEVTLHLKEDEAEFLEPWTVRSTVARYSDHIGFPIRMPSMAPQDDDAEKPAEPEWEDINKASALWTLPKSEIKDEEYHAFYQHVAHDMQEPMAWAHNKVEGNQSYTSLLYLPSKAPMDLLVNRDERHGLKLYVKRVFIMDAAEQLLPHYLRFVRGVVDSDDLPLNVSREILQENPLVKSIRSGITKRVLDTLKKMSAKDTEKYQQFWDEFGTVLKEGVVEDTGNKDSIAPLLRFSTSLDDKTEQTSSLDHYIERMKEDQKAIYYITASSFETAKNSPHLEIFRKNGIEVLLMSDRVDEWMMGYFTEYQELPFKSVAKGELELGDDEEKASDESTDDENKDDNSLTERIKKVLESKVSDVKESSRLTESPACLVLGEHDIALHMQRLLEAAGQPMPASKPSLEVNMEHPLLKRLEQQEDEAAFCDWSELLFEQALLAEGGQLDDPAGFVRRLNKMIQAVAGDS